jgi:transcriptional regulator with XRE-family HTH domain
VTTSPEQMSFLSEILEWEPIPEDKLVYFRERLRNRLHSAIIDAFLKRSKGRGLKQSDLATRIHRTRAQITRWFGTSSNLTLDSISDLMVGLGMDFDEFPFTPIEKTLTIKEGHAKKENGARALSAPFSSRQNRGEPLTIIQHELALASSRSSGATRVPIAAIPAGAVSDLAKTMQLKIHSEKVGDLAEYKRTALRQSLNASQIGEANAG